MARAINQNLARRPCVRCGRPIAARAMWQHLKSHESTTGALRDHSERPSTRSYRKKGSRFHRTHCPVCKKMVMLQGMAMHMRYKHRGVEAPAKVEIDDPGVGQEVSPGIAMSYAIIRGVPTGPGAMRTARAVLEVEAFKYQQAIDSINYILGLIKEESNGIDTRGPDKDANI